MDMESKENYVNKDINEKSIEYNTSLKSNNFDEMAIALTEKSIFPQKGMETTVLKVKGQHDCAKVDKENAELRRKLIRTRRALEDTFEKMRTANECKLQIEKNIKTQILKTHNVLKNVASNIQGEL